MTNRSWGAQAKCLEGFSLIMPPDAYRWIEENLPDLKHLGIEIGPTLDAIYAVMSHDSAPDRWIVGSLGWDGG